MSRSKLKFMRKPLYESYNAHTLAIASDIYSANAHTLLIE